MSASRAGPGRWLRKFFALEGAERRLFLEAWWTLGVMRIALLTRSFKKIARPLLQTPPSEGEEPVPEPRTILRAEKIARVVRRAAAHTPWESACLVQALTVWKMLERRGIPGCFYLGVDRRGTEGKMRAHAWAKCGDRILTGASGREAFTPVSMFRWGDAPERRSNGAG
jgi:hypothetical protein